MLEIGCSRKTFNQMLQEVDLKKEHHDILKAKFVEEKTNEQIQQMYFVSKSTIYRRLKKARGALFKAIINNQDLSKGKMEKYLEICRKIL